MSWLPNIDCSKVAIYHANMNLGLLTIYFVLKLQKLFHRMCFFFNSSAHILNCTILVDRIVFLIIFESSRNVPSMNLKLMNVINWKNWFLGQIKSVKILSKLLNNLGSYHTFDLIYLFQYSFSIKGFCLKITDCGLRSLKVLNSGTILCANRKPIDYLSTITSFWIGCFIWMA